MFLPLIVVILYLHITLYGIINYCCSCYYHREYKREIVMDINYSLHLLAKSDVIWFFDTLKFSNDALNSVLRCTCKLCSVKRK